MKVSEQCIESGEYQFENKRPIITSVTVSLSMQLKNKTKQTCTGWDG